MLKRTFVALVVLLAILAGVFASAAQAQDKLKVAISQRGFWDSSFLEFAQKEGMLKKAGLDVEFFFTEGGGQTLQVITSGSVDVAMSNGLLGTIGAYSKKAPIRVISAQMTGAHELYWYVRAESAIRSLKDATEKNTIAFSSPGSSSNLILLAVLNQAGSKARPTATGGLPGTLTSVMTGQIDIGWATPPFALRELQEKKIVIIGRAREATELRNQTIRVNIANVNSLKTKRDAITRLMQVYHEAIEWSYSNPKAIEYFAEFAKAPPDVAGAAVKEFFPKEALQIGEIRDLDRTLRDAVQYKFTATQLTPQDVAGLFDILYRPPAK
jgi:NitT/TauT family transport system substrate-binding protein